ncbi:TonB-dependent receptor [uncultured Phascolarctobacterium sp.]|uniref:TonB-dependent receptor plug domain-containing protein n=1 Tax=uncultured Phascolarctobacterium sp. TaxID=512296 RepID=UPI00262F0F3F|nr:TonB-dependent receptor [uncultured Phascolarctobacterium sp.]
MLNKKALVMSVLCAVASVGFVMSASAEETMSGKLDEVVVEESAEYVNPKNTYDGKVIRTGGDVNVITSKEIEKKHYTSVADAIKRLPGVDVQSVGYKAFEYDYGDYQDEVSINGDRRVVILVDGKRITNEANSSANNHYSKAQIFAMIGIQNVERIEVIKGASAMAYGSDATGGVINIITKKGQHANTTLDMAYGSWGTQKYAVSNTGKRDKLSWIVSYNKDKRNDMKYKDREYKKTRTYYNSSYDEDNTFVKLNYDFDKNNSVEFMHTYKNTYAKYPIMAPDYSSLPQLMEDFAKIDSGVASSLNPNTNGYNKLPQSDPAWNRYHKWWYVYNAGSYTKNRTSNYDFKYTFKDDDGIENYIRIFNDENRYYMDRNRPKFTDFRVLDYKQLSWAKEKSAGVNVRFGKKLSEDNTIYSGIDYSNNSFWQHAYASYYPNTGEFKHGNYKNVKRDVWSAFVQDKMTVNKLTVTPGIRYNYYGKNNGSALSNKNIASSLDTDSYSRLTMGLFADYEFDNNHSVYASWSQVYNAPYASAITSAANKLDAEKGNAYTLGYSGKISKSTFGVNYSLTKLDNTFGKFTVQDDVDPNLYVGKVTNVKSKVKAFGLTYSYRFDDTWSINSSYSHARTDIDENQGTSSELTTTDDLRNSLHYNNKYTSSIDYNKGKFSTGFDFTYYTGMNTKYFSDNQFFVVDWHANYKIDKNLTAYALVNNLTNTAYETKAVAVEGIGSLPMEGINFLVGVNYSF